MGVTIDDIEMWRSIHLFDYEFFLKDAVDVSSMYVISLDRLLFTRALIITATSEDKKHEEDFKKVMQYYHDNLRNQEF
ncbi:MAG: hypothetical protein FWB96_07830 [Defluviitaleaceae bacterium]|nr:hypothetical protein [Defluviitaleaceae bacterium]MCL2262897.1 hypothetical protein [Defluviitaleaceae bacterium]